MQRHSASVVCMIDKRTSQRRAMIDFLDGGSWTSFPFNQPRFTKNCTVVDANGNEIAPKVGADLGPPAEDEVTAYQAWLAKCNCEGLPAAHPPLIHPRNWENPEVFMPERFNAERSEGRPRMAFMPFGAGPRMCIGNHFAMMEMQLLLAMFVQGFTFALLPGQEVQPEPMITLRPKNGIQMELGVCNT